MQGSRQRISTNKSYGSCVNPVHILVVPVPVPVPIPLGNNDPLMDVDHDPFRFLSSKDWSSSLSAAIDDDDNKSVRLPTSSSIGLMGVGSYRNLT